MAKDRWGWLRKAARAGGLKRQAGLSPEERAALATKASHARFKGMTKAQRSEAAQKTVEARWKRWRARKAARQR